VSFRACRVFEDAGRVAPRLVEMGTDELSPGDVVVRVHWSGVNYKDALAVIGSGKILKKFPLNAGIDAAGIVESSRDARFKVGDAVLANGMGLGESHDGGFAEILRLPGDWLVPLPAGLTLRESMILGTAGFTAALAIVRMELNGQRPEPTRRVEPRADPDRPGIRRPAVHREPFVEPSDVGHDGEDLGRARGDCFRVLESDHVRPPWRGP